MVPDCFLAVAYYHFCCSRPTISSPNFDVTSGLCCMKAVARKQNFVINGVRWRPKCRKVKYRDIMQQLYLCSFKFVKSFGLKVSWFIKLFKGRGQLCLQTWNAAQQVSRLFRKFNVCRWFHRNFV